MAPDAERRGAYYNEIDPFAAAWLRELIKAGLIADGEVDERDIRDVKADDLRGFAQCHWFAGIGGWSYALRLAGWPDDRPVWTGSCPCQPFSSAGKGIGGGDDRHLWPHWARLIAECHPHTIFGEQVESAIAHGWIDAVFDDLEREGYACGAACLPAGSVGAPHIRQRLWFVAESLSNERRTWRIGERSDEEDSAEWSAMRSDPRSCSATFGVADAHHAERRSEREPGIDGCDRPNSGWEEAHGESGPCGEVRAVGDTDGKREGSVPGFSGWPSTDSPRGAWADLEWIACRDGKARPTQSGLFPLASGVPARVGRLRGYGNAIVPQVAAAFIEAFMSV